MNVEELATTRRRLEAMAGRARANAEYEADQCARLVRGIDLSGDEPGVPMAGAEKLAVASTALVRYLSALEAYQVCMVMLEDA